MQSQLIAGDSFNLLDTYANYPASEGWILKTTFIPRTALVSVITLIAVAEVDNFRTTVSANTTSSWVAGDYSVKQWVERSGERYTVATGNLKILPDPATMVAGSDTRSHLEKVIANIEAMLEGKSTKDVQEYTIGDRQLKHMTTSELLVWRDKYKAQLASENAANSMNSGPRRGRKIHVRF